MAHFIFSCEVFACFSFFVCILPCPQKGSGYFFEKDIYTKSQQTVAKVIFYDIDHHKEQDMF